MKQIEELSRQAAEEEPKIHLVKYERKPDAVLQEEILKKIKMSSPYMKTKKQQEAAWAEVHKRKDT